MFAYLRLFSVVSFIAVVMIAALVGMYFRSMMRQDLLNVAERVNLGIAQSYSASLWQEYSNFFQQNPTLSEAQANPEVLHSFAARNDHFFVDLPIQSATVFNAAGQAVYTLRPIRDSRDSSIARDIQEVRSTSMKPKTELLNNVELMPPPSKAAPQLDANENPIVAERKSMTLVKTLATIQAGQGYVELYTDVTNQWQKLQLLQWLSSGGIVIVFVILIWVLIITSKKAEAIIARQHESNMELAAAAATAQAENREKSLFLANISHELRTPLNAIIGFSEIIKNELMGNVQNQRYNNYINDIHSSGVHLLSLINDILDFSKAEAGKLEIEITEVNATKLISNSLRLVSPRAEQAGVVLVDAMPKEQFVLQTDNKKLKQVFLNLLSNSVKFTPQGGQVRVSAWQNVQDDSFTFEVRDTGIGIAAKDIAKAMAPFGQVDNTLSRRYEGTGLGLPLTKKFVEIMGGTFTIESEVGKGTTIIFTLPREYKNKSDVPVKLIL